MKCNGVHTRYAGPVAGRPSPDGSVAETNGPDSHAQSPWLGTAEAARYLGITPRTLYRLINEGQVPAYKLGRVIRVKTADLDDFLESARIEPGSLEHLYPEARTTTAATDASGT
jgi:excisionase family DNA binding protein